MMPQGNKQVPGKDNAERVMKNKPESLVARIATSATGLTKDLVQNPIPFDAARTLSRGASASQKLSHGSSSGESSRWAESLPKQSKSSTTSSIEAGDSLTGESFRSSPLSSATSLEFDDFYHNYGSSTSGKQRQKQPDHSSWTVEFGDLAPWYRDNSHQSLSITNAYTLPVDYDDGAAVRELLSRSGDLDDEAEEWASATNEPTAETVSDLFGESRSDTETQIAHSLRSTLPAPPVHSSMQPDNPLNLRPEFLSQPTDRPGLLDEIHDLESDLELVSGASHLDKEQRDHFLSEWDSVLNNYTDEVWGSMLPAVKEAKSELAELRAGKQSLDSKAVARLKMILGHVTQSNGLQSNGRDHSNATQRSHGSQNVLETSFASKYMHGAASTGLVHPTEIIEAGLSQQHRNGSSQGRKKMYRIDDYKHQQDVSQSNGSDEEEQSTMPTFHCPWISCHERFRSSTELRQHEKWHSMLACPHESCNESFLDLSEWIEHWQASHHDLLDTRQNWDTSVEAAKTDGE